MDTRDDRPEGPRGTKQRPEVRRLITLLILVGLVVLVVVAPIPAFTVQSGPVFSLGDELTVDGVPARDALTGDYLFTTIALERATTADLLRSWITPSIRVVARSRFIPAGVSDEAFLGQQQESFAAAARIAAAAAAGAAGVDNVDIVVANDIVGGPSAGLLTALAAFDVLDPLDLAAGRRIAGTGEVDAEGTVVTVGSVELKVRAALEDGADAFVLPTAQVDAAEAIIGAARMQVIPADTVRQAIDALSP